MEIGDRARSLRGVFWIGGATCAGKSTAADLLGERHSLEVYHFDRREPFHIYRSIPEEQPNLIRFMGRTMDDRWVQRSPEEMAHEVLACWTERFPMVLDDLERMTGTGPVIAEGAGFFPALLAPLLSHPFQAAWLIPSPAFQQQVRDTRGISIANSPHISDPDRARANLLGRDALLAAHIGREARDLGLSVIPVDAGSIGTLPERLDARLSEWLTALP